MTNAKVGIITGASSGIGMALARELARGGWSLGLLARRGDELEKLAAELRLTRVSCHPLSVDVTDRTAMHRAFKSVEESLGPVELFVANAGISVPTLVSPLNVDDISRVYALNFHAMTYGFEAALPGMLARKSGHLVAVSSLAGYFTFPGESAYCSSKAAVNSFTAGLRTQLAPRGVHVTTICPGFIRTPMVAKNRFKMPFLMDADEAARRMAAAIERRAGVYNFPWQTHLLTRMCRLLPGAVLLKMAKKS
jgi:short-subunit dehydrogenase